MYNAITHMIGRATGRYFFEDFMRVYPDGIMYSRLGLKRKAHRNRLTTYLNHRKFYVFASQFVSNKVVADVGCGSGYGCEILHTNGACRVYGCDIQSKVSSLRRTGTLNVLSFRYRESQTFMDSAMASLMSRFQVKSWSISRNTEWKGRP